MSGIWIRHLILTDGETEKKVELLQMDSWKDDSAVIKEKCCQLDYLVDKAMEKRREGKTVLVHCSAGIGRTGTLIALLCVIESIEA